MLLGESGTGKEVVARAIHNANPRGQFVPIDCGSLVGTLMESELFGHVKGSFSGAVENKKGLVEMADGGTAFFDEIGDLPLEMQVKLLRVLQEREFRAVGSLQWRKVDLRIIAATHRDLKAEVAAGRFRQDLYYRLNVFTIHLPPLRQRKEDIPLLVEHFPRRPAASHRPARRFWTCSHAYDWPGNVRELKHCVERMAAMQSEGALQMADLPSALQYHPRVDRARRGSPAPIGVGPPICLPIRPVAAVAGNFPARERKRDHRAARWRLPAASAAKAARLLGIGRTTLYRKMKEYG